MTGNLIGLILLGNFALWGVLMAVFWGCGEQAGSYACYETVSAWLSKWQTLVGSLIATVAAISTIIVMWWQIRVAQNEARRSRVAARSLEFAKACDVTLDRIATIRRFVDEAEGGKLKGKSQDELRYLTIEKIVDPSVRSIADKCRFAGPFFNAFEAVQDQVLPPMKRSYTHQNWDKFKKRYVEGSDEARKIVIFFKDKIDEDLSIPEIVDAFDRAMIANKSWAEDLRKFCAS